MNQEIDRYLLSMSAIARRVVFLQLVDALGTSMAIATVSVLILHFRMISISMPLYFENYSLTFVEVFRSDWY